MEPRAFVSNDVNARSKSSNCKAQHPTQTVPAHFHHTLSILVLRVHAYHPGVGVLAPDDELAFLRAMSAVDKRSWRPDNAALRCHARCGQCAWQVRVTFACTVCRGENSSGQAPGTGLGAAGAERFVRLVGRATMLG